MTAYEIASCLVGSEMCIRDRAKSLIEENAGSIVSSVTKKLDYLVTGEKPTNRKVEQAKNLGIKILTQKEWSDLLN